MELESFSALATEVTQEDWKRTPASVQQLLRWLFESYETRLADLEEDKALSKVEQEQSSGARIEKQTEASENPKEVGCSFCGKKQEEVSRLISGPNVQICNECVEICNEILEDE
jgi:hypothetical protein